jgi:hypothetical protein
MDSLKKNLDAEGAENTRRSQRKLQAVGHSHDTVAHLRDMKIQKIAELEPAEPEIAQQLATVYRQNCVDGFELNNHQIFDNEISSIGDVEGQILVAERQGALTLNSKAKLFKLINETRFVGAFQQAGPTRE